MSWGERSCSQENAPKNKYGGCAVAKFETCNVSCGYYTWDEFTEPDTGRDTKLHEGIKLHEGVKIGRNDPCPCSSGKKYKRCCG